MIGTIALVTTAIIGAAGIRIVRPTHKMLIETLGKYTKTAEQGFNWIIPIIQSGRYVNITERMVDVPKQMIQTKDKLNTTVDAVVYYQVNNIKSAEYNIDNYRGQLPVIARNTLRAVMGKMTLTECIQERDQISSGVEKVMSKETKNYGVSVLRVEVQRIEPPRDVQDSMNNVVKAEQDKIAATDYATAEETKADGSKRAAIKEAQGIAEGRVLVAKAKAKAIELVNVASEKYFKGNAQKLKQLEVAEESLKNNSKIILGNKSSEILKLFDLSK